MQVTYALSEQQQKNKWKVKKKPNFEFSMKINAWEIGMWLEKTGLTLISN